MRLPSSGASTNRLRSSTRRLPTSTSITKAIDPAKIGSAVDNADVFSRTLRERSPDVDKAILEARSITEKLNKSADKIDAVLDGAEKFLGSAHGRGRAGRLRTDQGGRGVGPGARRQPEPADHRDLDRGGQVSRIRACANMRRLPSRAARRSTISAARFAASNAIPSNSSSGASRAFPNITDAAKRGIGRTGNPVGHQSRVSHGECPRLTELSGVCSS